MIPEGYKYYPRAKVGNWEEALRVGIAAPTGQPVGVWLTPEVWERLKVRVDPAVERHVARQAGECKGCGG